MANQPRRGGEWKHHRWEDFGRQEAAQTPRSDSNRHSRDSLSAKISPPGLKRHRTVTEFSINSQERPSYALSRNESYPNSDSNHLRSFDGNKRPVHEQVRHERSFESLRRSSSFLGTSAYREFERRDSSVSAIETDGTHSGSSSRRGSLSKRTCRVCEKSSATTYNPMIMCPGCDRPYHDICRRPPLHEGDDPQRWRCLKCFNGPRKRKRQNFDLLRAKGSFESSSDRDLTPNGSISRLVDRTSSPVKVVREISNTPSKSVLSRSIYPDSPKFGPAIEINVYQSTHLIKSNPKDYAPVGHQPALVKSVPTIATGRESEQGAALTIACANCRQNCGFAEGSYSNIKCHDCQKQTVSTERGERVIPETPDMRQAQSPITPQNTSITPQTPSPLPAKAQSGKAIKSAPRSKTLGLLRPSPTPRAPLPVSKLPIIVKKDESANPMPFERTSSREPRNMPDLNKVKHIRNFHEVRGRDHQSAVETMTEAEQARKIDEIKGRGSRKKFFGRDHRLAHVRRHGRQDIHNECDGAWKPTCPPSRRNSFNNEMRDRDEPKSVREVFGLPEDAVPVNDGQTELAFRDGTLTNGRLPRSRMIYKVGKLFGGELTVRTSS